MKKLVSYLLCIMMIAVSCTAFAAADYNTAEKLQKQLNAGSGFSANITLDLLDSEGNSTLKQPVQFLLRYIFVRATENAAAINSSDLSLLDPADGTSVATVQVFSQDNKALLQSDLMGDDWYDAASLMNAGTSAIAQLAAILDSSDKTAEDAAEAGTEPAEEIPFASLTPYDFSGMPTLAATLAALMPAMSNEALAPYLDAYTTRIDLWLEGYRQATDLSKTDGDTTISVNYSVPAAAIKSEVKLLLMDMLENKDLMTALGNALGHDYDVLLQPEYQRFYFQVINDLPIEGDFSIERVVTLKGETVALDISLPLYDPETGAVTLNYSRTAATSSEAGTNAFSVTGNAMELSAVFSYDVDEQGYDRWNGEVRRTEGDVTAAQHFVATASAQEGRNDNGDDTYTCNYTLTLTAVEGTPMLVKPFSASLNAQFSSQTSKTAATYVKAEALVTAEDGSSVKVTLDGKSRKKWDVEIPEGKIVEYSKLTEDEQKQLMNNLLPGIVSIVKALGE